MVAIHKIDSYRAMEIELGGKRIPVSLNYKVLVQQAFWMV